MRGIVAFCAQDCSRQHPFRWRGPLQIHAFAQLLCVGFAGQSRHGYRRKVGIAQIFAAIGVGATHALDKSMQVGSAIVAKSRQIPTFEHV